MLLQEIFRSEWKRQWLEPRWSDNQPWPSKAHVLPYMAHGLDLWTSQLPCHSLHLELADQPLTFRCQNMEVLGECPAQIFSNSTNSLQTHENSWKFPSTFTTVAGGKRILFPCFEVLFRSKCGKRNEYFYKGLIRSMELTISFTDRELGRS